MNWMTLEYVVCDACHYNQYQMNPKYTPEIVKLLDKDSTKAKDLEGKEYHPGFVCTFDVDAVMVQIGINIATDRSTDFMCVVLHSIAHVPMIRNHFLLMTDTKVW